MPSAPPRRCPRPGCAQFVPCPDHKPGQRSRQAEAWHGLYDAHWRRARLAYLAEHPLCECDDCKREGWLKPATVVDHRKPHKGDLDLFWSQDNWCAMAKRCHDIKTARQDQGFGNTPRK